MKMRTVTKNMEEIIFIETQLEESRIFVEQVKQELESSKILLEEAQAEYEYYRKVLELLKQHAKL